MPLFAPISLLFAAHVFAQTSVAAMDPFVENHPSRKRDTKFPTLERLHVLFEFDPQTNTLYHRLSGEPVGLANSQGILIDGHVYYVNHILWLMTHGGEGGSVDVDLPSSTFVRPS